MSKLGPPFTLTPEQLAACEQREKEEPFFTVFPSLLLKGIRTWKDYYIRHGIPEDGEDEGGEEREQGVGFGLPPPTL